jgi:hypothetical protein
MKRGGGGGEIFHDILLDDEVLKRKKNLDAEKTRSGCRPDSTVCIFPRGTFHKAIISLSRLPLSIPPPIPVLIFNLRTICTYRNGCLCSGTVPGTVPYYISVVDPE